MAEMKTKITRLRKNLLENELKILRHFRCTKDIRMYINRLPALADSLS